jgi:hypothetical protein
LALQDLDPSMGNLILGLSYVVNHTTKLRRETRSIESMVLTLKNLTDADIVLVFL